MVTVEAIYKTLDKMREVYQFKDNNTVFSMDNNPLRAGQSVVTIATLDEKSGVRVHLEKDAGEVAEELRKGR